MAEKPTEFNSLMSWLFQLVSDTIGSFLGDVFYHRGAARPAATVGIEAAHTIVDNLGRSHAPSFQKNKRDEAAFAKITAHLAKTRRKAINEQWLASVGVETGADIIKSFWEMTAEDTQDHHPGLDAALDHLNHIASLTDNGRRTAYAAAQRFCKRRESNYFIVKVTRQLRRAWRLITGNSGDIATFNVEAVDELFHLCVNIIVISIVVFVLAFFAAAAHTWSFTMWFTGWQIPEFYLGKYTIFLLAIIYFVSILFVLLIRVRIDQLGGPAHAGVNHPAGNVPVLNAGFLFLEADVLYNLVRVLSGGANVRQETIIEGENTRTVTKIEMNSEFKWKWDAFNRAWTALWVVLNCELNAFIFLLWVPIWWYPALIPFVILLGGQWLLSHRELDFDWFRWFGTFCGYFFVSVITYIVVDAYNYYPIPVIPAAVAGIIVMFLTNGDKYEKNADGSQGRLISKSWWNSWQGKSKTAAIAATLVILLAPLVVPFVAPVQDVRDRIVAKNQDWQADNARNRQLREDTQSAIDQTKDDIQSLREKKVRFAGLNTADQARLDLLEKHRDDQQAELDRMPTLNSIKNINFNWFDLRAIGPTEFFFLAAIVVVVGLFFGKANSPRGHKEAI